MIIDQGIKAAESEAGHLTAGHLEYQSRRNFRDLCRIEDCQKAVRAKGLCEGHYKRLLRHGDPLAGRTESGAGWVFIKACLVSGTDECLVWPYAVRDDGYGQAYYLGKAISASRLITMLAHGCPEDGSHGAHSCHNRLCCNPRHLRWATPAENLRDRVGNGTHPSGEKNPAAKLTSSAVAELRRRFASGDSRDAICRDAGISKTQMYRIVKGQSWSGGAREIIAEIINAEADRAGRYRDA